LPIWALFEIRGTTTLFPNTITYSEYFCQFIKLGKKHNSDYTKAVKKKAKKMLILVIGLTFVLLGLLGLALPFLQGILFLIIGIFLLSFSLPKFQRWIKIKLQGSPKLLNILERTEKWFDKFIKK